MAFRLTYSCISKFIFSTYSIISLFYFISLYNTGINDIGACLLLAAIQVLAYFILGSKLQKGLIANIINPSTIALLGLLIVNFQNIVNIYCGYGSASSYSVVSINEKYFLDGSYLSFIGIDIFLLVLFIFVPIFPKNTTCQKQYHFKTKPWLWLLVVSFIGFVASANIVAVLSGLQYAEEPDNATTDMYFEGLFGNVFAIYVSLNTLGNKSDGYFGIRQYFISFPKIFWIVTCMYMAIRIVSGDRGPVMYNTMLLLYAYLYQSKHKLKLIYILGMGALAAFAITLIGIARLNAIEASFGERVANAYESMSDKARGQKSISPNTQELANSSQCIWISVKAHEENITEYQCGRYTILNIVQSVPFAGFFLKNIVGLNWDNVSSSSFITKQGLGHNPSYGLGTSAVADFYLELGLIGVVLGFISAAFIFKYIDCILYFFIPVSPWILIFVLKFASLAIYFCRSSLSQLIYQCIFCVSIFLIFNVIFKLKIK